MTAFERLPGGRRGGRGAGSPAARRVELVSTAVAVVLASRVLLGGGLLRFPAAIAAAALVGAMRRRRAAAGARAARPTATRRRRARAASRAANRAREQAEERLAHAGGWHPEPEVIEVKSPAELEQGIASATPQPTFSNRVDRGRHGAPGEREGRGRGRRRPRSGEAGAPAERRAADEGAGGGAGEVSPHPGYLAPDAGADVRERDLGAVSGPDAEPSAERASPERREPTGE